ncbi:hypothetical protein [Parerythrobacter aestuarii]|uniref:hypothetical protein n=1 Tax=Parerythrobacter aestuarii TaxID=3020909 RepID=UPI0024DEA816|nr:hypothetical protein [Parerythrobacter aestuarii]
MALIVLLTLGSAIGWLAAILLRQDSVTQSFANIAIGAVGALASHVIVGGGFAASSIDPEALLLGGIGAGLFLAVATVFRRRVLG